MGKTAVPLERRGGRRRSRSPPRSGSGTAGGELRRGGVPQRAVWSVMVVIVLPGRGQSPGLGRVVELLLAEELVPEPRMKTLRVTVLPR